MPLLSRLAMLHAAAAFPRRRISAGLLCAALVLALLLAAASPAQAEGLLLRNFVLDNHEGDMSLRFSIGLGDPGELAEVATMLQGGDMLALVCEASLYRKRGYWLDEPLAEGALQNLLEADPKRQLFVLEQPTDKVVRARSLQQLLTEAWRNLSINLGSFTLLERGERYTVELEVRLVRRDVPAWKRWTLFYSDFEVVSGARYQMDFQY